MRNSIRFVQHLGCPCTPENERMVELQAREVIASIFGYAPRVSVIEEER